MSNVNDAELDIKIDDVLKLFKELDYKHQIKSYKMALKKSASIIQRETRKNIRKTFGSTVARRKGKYKKNLLQGVKTSVTKDGKVAKVHIMGNYLLKFFEKGTDVRVLRKKKKKNGQEWTTGRIKPRYFFRSAIESKGKEAADSLIDNVKKSIQKVYDKIAK